MDSVAGSAQQVPRDRGRSMNTPFVKYPWWEPEMRGKDRYTFEQDFLN
jgi:hypothetical protein